MDSKWIIPETPSAEQINEIVRKTEANRLVAAVLAVRGFSADAAQAFLHKSKNCLQDPFLFSDMQKAVDRIETAIEKGEKITVYGDYDADGITASALLVSCLTEHFSARVSYYIPEREHEGYGMSAAAVESIANGGTTLIISVDCGITAVAECALAKSLGVDLIITDHHECGAVVPEAVAVLDPKWQGCCYPDKNLAGVGVALKLCQALLMQKRDLAETAYEYAEYVALGTIADIAPLLGENRVLCAMGLEKMQHSTNKGVQALLRVSDLKGKTLDTTKVGFQLAPKINAVGRLENAATAVELFLTADSRKAEAIAETLTACNQKRQQIEQEILEEADCMVQQAYMQDMVLVLCNPAWHHGVVGIVASRLTKKYNKPCIMISQGSDGYYKGSGRSLEGFSLYDALQGSAMHLVRFGGHELAAGIVIEHEKVDAFRKAINQYAAEKLGGKPLVPVLTADCVLRGRHLNLDFAKALCVLEPFGAGNKQPAFVVRNMTVQRISYIGNAGQHLKMQLVKDGCSVDAIAFSFGDRHVRYGDTVTVMANLDINVFRETESVQLKIIDMQ